MSRRLKKVIQFNMVAIPVMIILILLLSACSGGSGESVGKGIEPVVKASIPHSGAWNSPRNYVREDSELQVLVDNNDYIKLPCGDYSGSVIELHSNLWIEGSGKCTRIPSVRTPEGRSYYIKISNLTIDGNLDGYNNIGIDFSKCSICRVDNVIIGRVDYGVLLYGNAYYTVFSDVSVRARKECYEIVAVANANVIRDGNCQGALDRVDGYRPGIGVVIESTNSIKIRGTSFENLTRGILLKAGTNSTFLSGIRCEDMFVCVDIEKGAKNTTLIAPHISATEYRVRSSISSYIEY